MNPSLARRMIKLQRLVILAQWLVILAILIALIVVVAQPKPEIMVPAPESEPEPEHVAAVEYIEQYAPKEQAPIALGEFKTTAYCACAKCCGVWSADHPSRAGTGYVQKTAGGTVPEEGRTIAVDPQVIPLGTTVVIDGHAYVAEDTGGAVKGNTIDIFFASHEEANQYGVQYKNIYIKGE